MISTHTLRAHRAPDRHRIAFFTLLAVAVAGLFAAAPADAAPHRGARANGPGLHEHDFREPRHHRIRDQRHRVGPIHVCNDRCGLKCVVYRRAFEAGRNAGYRAGVQDGRWRRPYRDEPLVCMTGRGRGYVRAFNAGFVKAYADGYRRGKNRFQQRHRRPIRRVWWRW